MLQIEKLSESSTELESGTAFHRDRTIWYNAYKLDWSEGKWIKVKDLEDRMLFLGGNTSFSVSAFDFPNPNGKSNCIYFTDSAYYGDMGAHDFGVLSLEAEPLYPRDSSQSVFSSPIWALPAL